MAYGPWCKIIIINESILTCAAELMLNRNIYDDAGNFNNNYKTCMALAEM